LRFRSLILGDADGGLAVPRALAVEVLERAEQIIANEKKIVAWVAEGQTIEQITAKGQKRVEPATDAVRGVYGSKNLPLWKFPHRYKLAAWLTGKVPRPYARLPRTAFADEEVLMLRDALIRSGYKVVREPGECKGLGASNY